MNKKPRYSGSRLFMFKLPPDLEKALKRYQDHCGHPSLSYTVRQVLTDHLRYGTGSTAWAMERDRQYEKAFGHKP